MHRRTLALAAFVVLALPGGAYAGTPVTIGPGSRPAVAVDPTGTAHVAYEVAGSGRIGYCKLPRGATACTQSSVLGVSAAEGLNIFAPSATNVQIYGSSLCGGNGSGVVRFASIDGGITFGPAACKTPNTGMNLTGGENLLDAQGRFLATDINVFESGFLAFPALAAPNTASAVAQILTPGDSSGEGSTGISLAKAPGRLVAATAYGEGIRYSVYPFDADTASPAALNNAANWTRDLLIPGANPNAVPSGASGSAGAFIAFNPDPSQLDHVVQVRKLDPATNTFGPPVVIDGTALDTAMSNVSLSEGGAGRLHLIWSNGDVNEIRYARSTDGGQSFATLGRVAQNGSTIYRTDVAAAPDGQGWATFENATSVVAVPLEPTPDPVAPITPLPVATPPPPGGAVPPTPVKPVSSVKETKVSASGADLTFQTPRACVRAGSTFVVTLKFAKQKRKGNVFVKVFRVDFSGTGIKRTIDKRAPFRKTLRVKVGTTRGAKVSVRARAFMKVSRGKSPTKSIRASVTVCA